LSRHTPVYITIDGIIIDGHHGTRACAEAGRSVEIEIRETGPNFSLPPLAASILDLEVSVD
jgi:hypothetical protein